VGTASDFDQQNVQVCIDFSVRVRRLSPHFTKKFFLEVVHGRNPKYRNWCYPIYDKAAETAAKRQDPVSVK
jgi:hypothetical protein